jgi:hypothetical protein
MNKSFRMHMIRRANESLQSRRKQQVHNMLFERELKKIEGDDDSCLLKNSSTRQLKQPNKS